MLGPQAEESFHGISAVNAEVPDSMFTLFRVMSGAQSDSESAALDSAWDSKTCPILLHKSVSGTGWYKAREPSQGIMDNIPTFKFAFVFFMVTSSWTLLSILTAVVAKRQEMSSQLVDGFRHICKRPLPMG